MIFVIHIWISNGQCDNDQMGNTTLGGWPSSQQSHHSPFNDQNHNGIMGQL